MAAARVLGKSDGANHLIAGLGARFMVSGEESGGEFSLVEHLLEPRALATPLHRHSNEDEYSYVLEGRISAQLGDVVVSAEPGDLIVKPRGEWHTFWNATDRPARLLEIISPAGFERYFEQFAELLSHGPPNPPDIATIASRYHLELVFTSIQGLVEQHGLRFGN